MTIIDIKTGKPLYDEATDQVLDSEAPHIPENVVYWYHVCPRKKMDNIKQIRGFTCPCGARAPDHEKGPYKHKDEL
jgi:hypothetical protein